MRLEIAFALLGCLAGGAFAQEPSSKAVNFYSLAKEKELGQALAAKAAASLPIVHQPKIEAYVSQLAGALAKSADPAFDYTFTLYDDRGFGSQIRRPDASPVVPAAAGPIMPEDAFQGQASEPAALPGGPVFIPLSLLAASPDETVFAFQLAHAVAHIFLRQGTRRLTKIELTQIAARTAQDALTRQGAEPAVSTGQLTFSRAAEREADYWAVQVLSKAGYSAEPVAAWLSALPVPGGPRAFLPRPTPGDRAKAIRDEIEKLQLPPATAAPIPGFAEAKAAAAAIQ